MINPIFKMMPDTQVILNEVIEHLEEYGLPIPKFEHEILDQMGGSYVLEGCMLTLGFYPNRYMAKWFVMHEFGHILCSKYKPCNNKEFAKFFGASEPGNYEDVHRKYSPLSALGPLSFRPTGEPSHYGAKGGGEERFCELLGLMYASGGFDQDPPADLDELWSVCKDSGFKPMMA